VRPRRFTWMMDHVSDTLGDPVSPPRGTPCVTAASSPLAFEEFVREHEPRLRRALVAAYGGPAGREATAEALAYAWEHWERVRGFENLPGYLYRVGQSRTRWRKAPVTFAPVVDYDDPMVEPGLGKALATLSVRQRTAVVLVHGFGWTLREVADRLQVTSQALYRHVKSHDDLVNLVAERAVSAHPAPPDRGETWDEWALPSIR